MTAPLLAFDTSTETMSIAVDGPRGRACWNGPGGALASAALLPQVQALLAQQGLVLGQLAAVAFGAGPGAFTGLRTACSVAQGLAHGVGIPVLPIDSMMIVAEDARTQGVPGTADEVGIVMDARMGELYAARYFWSGHGWTVSMPARLCRPAQLIEAWQARPPAMLAGTGAEIVRAALQPSHATVEVHDRAHALMELARRLLDAGAGVDAAAALPVYVRDKVAQTTAERQALCAPDASPR